MKTQLYSMSKNTCVRVTVSDTSGEVCIEHLSEIPPDMEELTKQTQSNMPLPPLETNRDFAAPFRYAPQNAVYEDTASLMYEDEEAVK
jgi:hypothetical protein